MNLKTTLIVLFSTLGIVLLLMAGMRRSSKLSACIAILGLVSLFSAAVIGDATKKMGWLDPIKKGWTTTHEWVRKPFGDKP